MRHRHGTLTADDLRRACARHGGDVEDLSAGGVGDLVCDAPPGRVWRSSRTHSVVVVWETPADRQTAIADALERLAEGTEVCPGCEEDE